MKLNWIFLCTIILLLTFIFILHIYEDTFHDFLFGKYVDGSIAVTVNQTGNGTVVTNNGGPDLDKVVSIIVSSNNQKYNLGLKPGSSISFPYHNGSLIVTVLLDQGGIFNEQKIHEFIVLNTTL